MKLKSALLYEAALPASQKRTIIRKLGLELNLQSSYRPI